jgi:hypothetical protein
MRYVLEIVAEKGRKPGECVESIESDSPIPIPVVGDEVVTASGWNARVVSRHFWFTYVNRVPLVKTELRCRSLEAEPAPPARRK